ncbi:hypothetical protein LC605_08520 [Nostoc sp. CHAB 5836]|uniref:hypothetical protein n=1 Tax=Nostoc sp. CHAB 5836 TaxID=2780404 RepID=UPI001E63153A|nr:hypothetical protein [Nostoc sp. CHAB 5836]MCC5615121.1 hypothetical protein [Nostoc sp. CHAB 5836]
MVASKAVSADSKSAIASMLFKAFSQVTHPLFFWHRVAVILGKLPQAALRKLWRQYVVSYGCFPNPTNDWVEANKTLHHIHWRLRKAC